MLRAFLNFNLKLNTLRRSRCKLPMFARKNDTTDKKESSVTPKQHFNICQVRFHLPIQQNGSNKLMTFKERINVYFQKT